GGADRHERRRHRNRGVHRGPGHRRERPLRPQAPGLPARPGRRRMRRTHRDPEEGTDRVSPISTLVLATRNAKKVPELRAILGEAGLDIEVRGLDGYPDAPEVAETEPTFTGNALLKARAIAAHTGLPAVADD